jgi:ankyrin repeat protein
MPIVKLLIEEVGVDKNAADERGRRPLHEACKGWHSGDVASRMMLIRYLIQEAACDVYVLDAENKLPEEHIRWTDEVPERLAGENQRLRLRSESMKAEVVAMLQVRLSHLPQ